MSFTLPNIPATSGTLDAEFRRGFARALLAWRAGWTLAAITNAATGGTSHDNGVTAAVDMLSGWLDLAVRTARLSAGMTREAAERFIAEQREAAL